MSLHLQPPANAVEAQTNMVLIPCEIIKLYHLSYIIQTDKAMKPNLVGTMIGD